MEFYVVKDMLTQPPHIMGKSPKILQIFREIKKIAAKNDMCLISGENGTYKELVAKAIHYNSPRNKGPFITINFASMPKKLAEAELFGYEKSTSAGMKEKRISKMEEAHGGTLFLDEITEMNISLQEKILKFYNDKEISLRKESPSILPDVMIIGATSKNMKEVVSNGEIKKEFYNILNGVHIKIPPLRERKEDIMPLAKYFLEEAIKKFETGPKELSKEAKDFLLKYAWPCNMRELENTIKRAAILSNSPVINKKDLLIEDVGSCSIKEFLEEKLKRYLKEMTQLENCNLYDTVLSEVERSLITIVLKETRGNQFRAAKTLGINRNTLRAKINEYKISI